ncbi:MAG: putative stomatin/prohibitin-family rane protease [Polyangiaceae bacterium]|jgi:regulator of protease activity HflC (stomatin/prohibitin superfamily)|nr:putative stomatin/prohibitin-family rane protease [Polyangiaceae bacterium]
MFKVIQVKLNERVVLLRDSLPFRALGPGRHWVWGTRLTEQRFNVTDLVFRALPQVRAQLDDSWFREVTVTSLKRGVLFRDGVPAVFLRPGVHRFWTIDPSVSLTLFDVTQAVPALTAELEQIIPKGEYIDVTVQAHEVGLRYEQGRLTGVLEPGRYKLWTHPEAQARIAAVDLRRTELAISGQELMTRDKVSLRLSLSVAYAIEEAALATQKVDNVRDAVYSAVQLAARGYVAGVTLDELLEGRDAFARFLADEVAPKAKVFGVRVDDVGVKDVVLPGEMKTLLNRVIEAEKAAAANVISRREETAATRSLVNTARLMADQPILLRLKELEAMKDIAAQISEVRIVVGADHLQSLLPSQLLGRAEK